MKHKTRNIKRRAVQMLHASRFVLRDRRGFTVVEMLVATTLFATILSLVSTIFIYSLRSQRAVTALIAANDNTYLMLEQISRELRVGRNFVLNTNQLSFRNTAGENISYRFISELQGERQIGRIERSVNGGAFDRVSAENVNIRTFTMSSIVGGSATHLVGDGRPARITFFLSIGALGTPGVENIFTNVQMTTTARNLDS